MAFSTYVSDRNESSKSSSRSIAGIKGWLRLIEQLGPRSSMDSGNVTNLTQKGLNIGSQIRRTGLARISVDSCQMVGTGDRLAPLSNSVLRRFEDSYIPAVFFFLRILGNNRFTIHFATSSTSHRNIEPLIGFFASFLFLSLLSPLSLSTTNAPP
jgi:hypothetical protein